VRRQKTRLALR